MKANHNKEAVASSCEKTVSKSKITKKWKPITTTWDYLHHGISLFQRAKLQKNESQSQHRHLVYLRFSHCFKEQNYKKMKANHNTLRLAESTLLTVSKSKITKKWKPITTIRVACVAMVVLFQRAKLQKNESQSQHISVF